VRGPWGGIRASHNMKLHEPLVTGCTSKDEKPTCNVTDCLNLPPPLVRPQGITYIAMCPKHLRELGMELAEA